jgi:hypothetical protein
MSGEPTHLDHVISQHGHKTVNLERLPQYLKKSKSEPRPTIEDLQREIGRLRQEIAYQEESNRSLMHLHQCAREAYGILHESLQTGLFQGSANHRSLSLYSAARKSELWLKKALRHVSEQFAASEARLLESYKISLEDILLEGYPMI